MYLWYNKDMIKSDVIKIEQTDMLDDNYVESELKKNDIDPIRWSIVDADADYYFVSVSYDC